MSRSRKPRNRTLKYLLNDDKGDPLLYVDYVEWRTWPRCSVCKLLKRPKYVNGKKIFRHEGCELIQQMGRTRMLEPCELEDITAEQVDEIIKQQRKQIAYEKSMGLR